MSSKVRTLTLIVLAVIVLAGCATSDESEDVTGADTAAEATIGEETAATGALEAIRERGRLLVGSQLSLPPFEFYDEDTNELQGIDVSLARAIGEELGLDVEFVDTEFAGLITGLESGRFDVIMSSMYDTAERQQTLDFVDYIEASGSMLAQKGNPEEIATLQDVCGKALSVQLGTVLLEQAEAQAEECEEPIDILTFDNSTDALAQVRTGRATVYLTDLPIASYIAQTEGGGDLYEVVGTTSEQLYGIGIPQDGNDLRDAIREALQTMIDDGTYGEILEEWSVGPSGIGSAEVNQG